MSCIFRLAARLGGITLPDLPSSPIADGGQVNTISTELQNKVVALIEEITSVTTIFYAISIIEISNTHTYVHTSFSCIY